MFSFGPECLRYYLSFVEVRRRIILEPGKRDVEIIVNQVKADAYALMRMVTGQDDWNDADAV